MQFCFTIRKRDPLKDVTISFFSCLQITTVIFYDNNDPQNIYHARHARCSKKKRMEKKETMELNPSSAVTKVQIEAGSSVTDLGKRYAKR